MSSTTFDPSASGTKAQLLLHLGCSSSTSIQELNNPGARNIGLWLLTDGSQELVLKLISSKRKQSHAPTDTERCQILAKKHPGIENDNRLTFPGTIFKCSDPCGNELYDLSVMKKAAGLRMADILCHHCRSNTGQLDTLVEIFHKFGMFLTRFHETYQMQHGDCHPSNVFYDASTDQ